MNTSDSILRLNGYPWMCPDLAIGSSLTRARDPADPSSLLMSRLQKVCFHYTKSQNNSGRHRITVAVNQTCSWHIAAKPVCYPEWQLQQLLLVLQAAATMVLLLLQLTNNFTLLQLGYASGGGSDCCSMAAVREEEDDERR